MENNKSNKSNESNKSSTFIFKVYLFLFSLFNIGCVVLILCYLAVVLPERQARITNDLLNSSVMHDKLQLLEERINSLKQSTLDDAKSMISKMQDDAVGIFLERLREFKSEQEVYLDKALLSMYSIQKRLYQGIAYNDLLFNIKNYYGSNNDEKLQNALDLLSKYSYSGVSSFYKLQSKLSSVPTENKINNKIISRLISVESKENSISAEVLARTKELVMLGDLEGAIDSLQNLPQQYFFAEWIEEAKSVAAVHYALDEIFGNLKNGVMISD